MHNNEAFLAKKQRVEAAISAIKQGKMVIMTDNENRENEGDFVFAAEHCSPEYINTLCKKARGLICLAMSGELLDALELPMMADPGRMPGKRSTAFTVSIEAREGVTTGISAKDRSRTIQVTVADGAKPEDIVVPGHIFPLRAEPGGVLVRAGHTEGSLDLVRMAGFKSAAVICEIMKDDGTMARLPELQVLAEELQIPIVQIDDLIAYRLTNEHLVEQLHREKFEVEGAVHEGFWFKELLNDRVHFALVKSPENLGEGVVNVRVQRQNPLSDVFQPDSVSYGLKMLKSSDQAVFLYLQSDLDFFKAADPSKRNYDPRLNGIGLQILKSLGVNRMKLHLGSERALFGVQGYGLEVVDTVMIGQNTKERL